MPDAFVTTTELAIHNDWADLTYPTDRALQAIWAATSQIQAYTGQRFVTVAGDTVTKYTANGVVWLPQRPVTAVTQYAIEGVAYANAATDWTLYPNGALHLLGWVTLPAWVTVTYSHGYAPSVTSSVPQPFPEQVKWVCNTAATRLLDNPSSLRSETVGSVSQTWGGGGADLGPGLTQAEKDALNPYKSLVLA